jgi:hypothetical protein
MDDSFITMFFQMQHASFSAWCGCCTVVGSGMQTRNNISACAHKWQNNRMAISLHLLFQASAYIMDLDLQIFDSERLITEV